MDIMTDNEKLIASAKDAIANYDIAKAHRVSVAPDRLAVILAEMVAVFEKAHTPTESNKTPNGSEGLAITPTDDEREALADRLARRLIGDPKQLMLAEGTGALHVALSDSVRSVIEDVYADCGDSDPGVLSSNIAQRLAWDLPPAILADPGFRHSEVPEPVETILTMTPGKSMCHCNRFGGGVHKFNPGVLIGKGCPSRSVPEPQGEPSDAKVEAAARRLFGATIDSMDRARELARVALTAPPLVACPHWAPGEITFRNGCTACADAAAGGVR